MGMQAHPVPVGITDPVLKCLASLVVVVLLVLTLPVAIEGQEAGAGDEDLGVVELRAPCAPGAQEDLDRAAALLHHMMYQQARRAFEEVAREHPGCGMAHWGVAMTLFQPLWPARPDADARRRGWEAVHRAQEDDRLTEREQALVRAAEAFFRDPAADEWWPRIERWHEAMEAAYRERPEDPETAAFYALSLLAAGQVAEDQAAHNARAARILEEIHERRPRHPGAIHYTIHASDITGRADASLEIVRSYDDMAPTVPHALHMPSHIFVRLGEWPEVIEWNRRSADAALEHPAGDRISIHYPHALDYLLYAHLQRGEDAAARAVLDELHAAEQRYQEDFTSAFHLAVMPARYAVERRAWEEAAALQPRSPGYLAWDRYWWPESLTRLARGLAAAHRGDLAAAREEERRMAELRDQARSADEEAFARYIEIDRLILSGWIAQAGGEEEAAVARLREAAELERTVEKHAVTPGALLPAYEALGDLLLEQERPAEALEAYQRSLEIWPDRYNSLLGAARAARDAGDVASAREHYGRLLEVTADADTDRPGGREARRFVGS